MKEIRFASIPKCASRTLKALGLLGEIEGRCHTKITEYPEWEKYDWHFVCRGSDWEESWWMECKRTKNMFADWLGFQYQNLNDDLALLDKTFPDTEVPRRPGLNAWIPEHFKKSYPAYVRQNFGLHEYCFDMITERIPCKRVDIGELDQWLKERGYDPIHMNVREIDYAS